MRICICCSSEADDAGDEAGADMATMAAGRGLIDENSKPL
jgi:hypothetical protein